MQSYYYFEIGEFDNAYVMLFCSSMHYITIYIISVKFATVILLYFAELFLAVVR